MSWLKLFLGAVVAALVIAAVGLTVSRRLRPQAVPSVTLSDGSQLRVEHMTVGTNHVFNGDPQWKETLRQKLPLRLRNILGTPAFKVSTTTHASELVLWMTQFDPVTGRSFRPTISSLEAIDDHGYAFYCGASGSTSTPGSPPVRHHYVPVFPRRQESFTIRFHDGKIQRELTLRNPAVWQGAEWQAPPLPQTKPSGDLEITLQKIVSRSSHHDGRYYYDFPFEVRKNGQLQSFWETDSIKFADATGNQDNNSLSPFEPAWNLQVKLVRSPRDTFSDSEILHLTHSAAPEPGEFLTLTNTSQFISNGITFAALTGPGQFDFANGACVAADPWEKGMSSTGGSSAGTSNWSERFASPQTALLLVLRNFPRDKILRVRARDASGRIHPGEGGERMSSSSGGTKTEIRRYQFKSLTNAANRELDFELISQTPVQVEFLVKPPEVRK